MTFYEQELRKIIGEQYPDATYVGRACYVRLGEMNRAKIQFVTGMVGSQYNALQITILGRSEGQLTAGITGYGSSKGVFRKPQARRYPADPNCSRCA